MLSGEHTRSKVYTSCFGVLKKLATSNFLFRGFQEKKTLSGCI